MAPALTLKILQFRLCSSLLPLPGQQTPLIDIIRPSLWLQHVAFPSSVLSVFNLSPKHSHLTGLLCRLCPRRKAGIKRLLERKDVCDQTGCDTEPLNLSVCHKHLHLQPLDRLQHQNCSCDHKDRVSCSLAYRGGKTDVNKNSNNIQIISQQSQKTHFFYPLFSHC